MNGSGGGDSFEKFRIYQKSSQSAEMQHDGVGDTVLQDSLLQARHHRHASSAKPSRGLEQTGSDFMASSSLHMCTCACARV